MAIDKVTGKAWTDLSKISNVAKDDIAKVAGQEAPAPVPLHWWDVKNSSSYPGSGTTFYDVGSSATKYNMTGYNGVVYNSSAPAHFDYDGVNDYHRDGTGLKIFGSNDTYSFESWFRLDALLSTTDTTPIYALINKGGGSNTDSNWKLALRGGSYNGLMFFIGTGGTLSLVQPSSSSFLTAVNDTTNWHQVVVTIDPANNVAGVYLDGVSYSVSISSSLTGRSGDSNYYLEIGKYYDTGSAFSMNGDISETAIYDKALSAAEVTALYNSKIGYY